MKKADKEQKKPHSNAKQAALPTEKYLAFSVEGAHNYCVLASSIQEVSICEKIVPVPLTKKWVRGVVNSKGVLSSVVDFSLFLGEQHATKIENSHLLYIRDEDLQCALLVDKVFGFRRFDDKQKKSSKYLTNISDSITTCVDGLYEFESEKYLCINLEKLVLSEQFREVQ